MSPAKPSASVPAPSRTLSRLLYVDDDPTLTLLTRISLERVGGFTVQTCASGAEALAAIETFAPDLVLLDVMMPGMDGPSTLEALRRMPAFAELPVIFMTAKVQDDDMARYRELGAADVIGKPYDPVKLPELVRTIWQRWHGGGDVARLDDLRAALGEAEFRRLLDTFLGDLARRLTAMTAMHAGGDVAGLERAAHTLKGTAGSYGLDRVSDLAGGLETACGRRDPAAVVRALAALSAGIGASTAQLRERYGLGGPA